MSVSGSISRKRVGSVSQNGRLLDSPMPLLDIQSIQMPSNPQNALALKTAALSSNRTLYQICTHLRRRLRLVLDFGPFLEQPHGAEPLDIVSHMCHLFRLGSPLCHLYNLLIPSFTDPHSGVYAEGPEPKPIQYDFPEFMSTPQGVLNYAKRPENAKVCQKYIAVFTMALKQREQEGRWHGESWALHELWGKSTGEEMEAYDSTGLMKVLQTVETMLDNLPEEAMSTDSPTTPHTANPIHGHMIRPSYDMPFSLGGTASGAAAVASMAATMNGGVHINAEETAEAMQRSKSSADSNAFKSVEELVSSEKSYVQELEILVRCSQEMITAQLISTDQCHNIFSNLSKILDFHRKFLIKLETEYEPIEEGSGPRAWAEGRWGRPFVTSETEFGCYGPYCANYLDAMQIVNEHMPVLMRGQNLPLTERPCLHPERELQAFMIKPIQRLTKYQLLLDAIINTTAKHDYPYRSELEAGAAAVRRIASGINEVTDFKAKQATVRELIDRVEDWKGHDIDKFGDLYLDDHFTVTKADQPRDYHVFLFEKMMLCCKEVTPDRKDKKTKSALRKDKGRSNTVPEKKRLALKGRIFVANIHKAATTPAGDGSSVPKLTIGWTVPHRHPSGYAEELQDWFIMTGKSEDTLKKWSDKVMELADADRLRQSHQRASGSGRQSGRMSASSQFQMSQWAPPTPAAEAPPFQFPPPLPQHGHHGDEDEFDPGMRSGRTTPSLAGSSAAHMGYAPVGPGRRVQSQQGMPPMNQAELRARAMTEDQNGPSMTQWRQQAQMPHMPPMPRLMSTQSAMSTASEASFGHTAGRPSIVRNMSTASRLGPSEEVDEGSDQPSTSYSARYPSHRGMQRAPSQGHPSVPYPAPLLRNRSASSPNVYQQPQISSSSPHAPPLPGMPEYDNPDFSPPSRLAGLSTSSTLVGGTAYFTKRMSGGGKRSSSESHLTETSETSSGPSPATPYAMNPLPVSRQNSGEMPGGLGGGSAILLRVRNGECSFSIGVPLDITYPILHQKIAKKIRLFKGHEPTSINIKWLDSEHDEISVRCDADVESMFDEARDLGWDHINLIAKS